MKENLLDILDELQDLTPEQRTMRISELGLSEEDADQLGRWLKVSDQADKFLTRTPSFVQHLLSTAENPMSATEVDRESPAQEREGSLPDHFGRYKIISVLGRGGMGVVYAAQQENPRRIVALKVIHPRLAGRKMIRRFELEAEILGRLEHPNIARIYEAGTVHASEGAQPFFAMELVRGSNLTKYAQEQGLSPRQRLEIVAKICDAVHHAHQKGIVHRDLKPGNILVDATGEPRVLDFGVARVTDVDLKATIETNAGQIIGTLSYMSPEQASGNPNEVDTRSDVYSLGIVAYEFLSGSLPYQFEKRMLHEIVRAIREEEAPRLSLIAKSLGGDIETVIFKALEKEKTRRYQSASDLAADIRRYLRDEPIIARPASTGYQIRKFAKRNRVLVAGLVAVFVSLILGMSATMWQSLRATAAQKKAENAAQSEKLAEQKAQQELGNEKSIAQMLSKALMAPVNNGYDVTVLQVLGNIEPDLEKRSDLPLEVRDQIRIATGESFYSYHQFDQAIDIFRRAIADHNSSDAPDDLNLATLDEELAYNLLNADEFENVDEIYGLLNKAVAIRTRLSGPKDLELLKTQSQFSMITMQKGNRSKGEQMYLESVRPLLGPNLTLPQVRGEIAADVAQAEYLWKKGDRDGAEAWLRHCCNPLMGNEITRAQIPDGLGQLALYVLGMGDQIGAEACAITATRLSVEINGANSAMHAKILAYTGKFLVQKQHRPEGVEMLDQAVKIASAKVGPLHDDTITYAAVWIESLTRFGRLKEALQARNDLLALAAGPASHSPLDRARILRVLGQVVYSDPNSTAEEKPQGIVDMENAVQIAKSNPQEDQSFLYTVLLELEPMLRSEKRFPEAAGVARNAVAVAATRYGSDDRHVGIALNRLGIDLQNQADYIRALGFFRKSHDICTIAHDDASDVIEPLQHIAEIQELEGQLSAAESTLRDLLKATSDLCGENSSESFDARRRLAWIRFRQRPNDGMELYRTLQEACARELGPDDAITMQIRKDMQSLAGTPAR